VRVPTIHHAPPARSYGSLPPKGTWLCLAGVLCIGLRLNQLAGARGFARRSTSCARRRSTSPRTDSRRASAFARYLPRLVALSRTTRTRFDPRSPGLRRCLPARDVTSTSFVPCPCSLWIRSSPSPPPPPGSHRSATRPDLNRHPYDGDTSSVFRRRRPPIRRRRPAPVTRCESAPNACSRWQATPRLCIRPQLRPHPETLVQLTSTVTGRPGLRTASRSQSPGRRAQDRLDGALGQDS